MAQANTKLGVSILMLALYYEASELVVPIRSKLDAISFFEAAATREIEAVKTALQAEHSVCNAYAPDGFTALGLAIFPGNPPSWICLGPMGPTSIWRRFTRRVQGWRCRGLGQFFLLEPLGSDLSEAAFIDFDFGI